MSDTTTTTTNSLASVRLGESFYRRNVARIQEALAGHDAIPSDGLLLLDAFNVIYASGFFHSVSERPIGLFIAPKREPILLVPLLEQEHAAETWIQDVRTYFEFPGEEHPVVWMARTVGAKRLWVDSISVGVARQLSAAGVTVETTALVNHMRYVKQPEEIALIERATDYADYCVRCVYEGAGDIVRQGGSELDILNAALGATRERMNREIDNIFALRGGSVVGTVHSGPQAALPHGNPGRRQPRPGETLIAGIGAMVGGYHAESGITFILGEPTADQLHCLRAAAETNDTAIAALQAGATCASVNEAALSVLHRAGLSDAIRHRIGHGMGLQGHEAPWLAPGDSTRVQAGMVFSNEPGIYRPGIDGYRTITTMIVTEGAASVPNHFYREVPPENRVIAV